MRRAGGRGRRVVVGEGRLNVIKEGGVTQSLASPFALIPDTENIGRVSFLGRGGYYTCEGGWVRGRGTGDGGGGEEEVAKDSVVSRTFYSVSSGWRLLSASQRTNSSSLPIPPPFLLPFYLLSSLLTSLLPSFRARSNPPPTTYDAPSSRATISLLRIFLVHADFHKSIFHSFVSSLSERKVNDRNRT